MSYGEYQRGWHGGLPETPCGYGSKMSSTKFQRHWIPEMVAKYGITSIADIGAGDLNWIKHTKLGCDYAAYDLVPRHDSVTPFDLLKDKLPKADCLMVLWLLNHFSPADQKKAINKLRRAKSRYLMMTWDRRMEPFTDLNSVEKEILSVARDGRDLEIRLIQL